MQPALLRLFAVLLIGLALIVPVPTRAGDTIRLLNSEVRPDFPAAITFELTAEAAGADIAAVQLLYGPTRAEALTVVDLPVVSGPRAEVSHTLDTRVSYFPPGTELTYRWVVADASGSELVSEPQTVVYHDDRFPWRERSERNVTVFWYEGDDAFGRELMAVTTRTLDRLERAIGARLEQPVRIYIYADTGDMRSALESNSVEWVGGQAHPGLGIIVGAITPGDSPEVERLIPHELSHQVLHQATDNPYGGVPVWFDEGLAVHNQEQRDPGWDAMVAGAAIEGRLIPLEALTASFPADPNQALLSYAQSRNIVEFIIASYGEAKLAELSEAFAAATPVDEALPQVLGRTVDELDADWRATLPPQVEEAPVVAGPQTAPPERFAEGPAPDPAATPAPMVGAGWLGGLAVLPVWAILGALALCCMAGAGVVGGALLVGLRLLGVDKRTN